MITSFVGAALLSGLQAGDALRPFNVPDLCQYVAENIRDTRQPGWDEHHSPSRVYRTLLFREAGVDVGADGAEAVRSKMQRWWNANQDRLLCNVPHSVVRDGSILRLAVDRSNTDLINDAARRWRVDLNYRDRNDGGTVLDFIDREIEGLSPGNPRRATLTRYRVIFEMNGGRRSRDLR